MTAHDFANSGRSISACIMDAVRVHGKHIDAIRWGDHNVWHVNRLAVPRHGVVRLEFLKWNPAIRQAVDIKVDGAIVLPDSRHVTLLRTWRDEAFEDIVEYGYTAADAKITTWNVYVMPRSPQPEMWTADSGMWYEDDAFGRTIHCNAGMTTPPAFTDLVYRLSVRKREG